MSKEIKKQITITSRVLGCEILNEQRVIYRFCDCAFLVTESLLPSHSVKRKPSYFSIDRLAHISLSYYLDIIKNLLVNHMEHLAQIHVGKKIIFHVYALRQDGHHKNLCFQEGFSRELKIGNKEDYENSLDFFLHSLILDEETFSYTDSLVVSYYSYDQLDCFSVEGSFTGTVEEKDD